MYYFKRATSCNFPSFLNLINPPLPAASKENLFDHSPAARRARAYKINMAHKIEPFDERLELKRINFESG